MILIIGKEQKRMYEQHLQIEYDTNTVGTTKPCNENLTETCRSRIHPFKIAALVPLRAMTGLDRQPRKWSKTALQKMSNFRLALTFY